MLTIKTIGKVEAHRALAAGLAEAERRGLRMAFAVADMSGDLLLCERMDGVPARVLQHAIRKAYTSGRMGRDTSMFSQQLAERGGDLTQWGDSALTTLTGGVAVFHEGDLVGAVACGGARTDIDAEIARIMSDAALQSLSD